MPRYALQRRAKSTARFRLRVGQTTARPEDLTRLYRGAKGSRAVKDIYASDHGEQSAGGRFRWLLSTCLAGAVGALAIIVVVYGSADPKDSDGPTPTFKKIIEDMTRTDAPVDNMVRHDDGLKWAIPRTDRLQVTSGATATRYTIHETLKQKKSGREYIYAKPYMRIVLRLAPVPPGYEDVIPPFNPFKLYGNSQPIGTREPGQVADQPTDVSVKVVELLGGILPGEDGQELEPDEVAELVEKSKTAEQEPAAPAATDAVGAAPPAEIGAAEPPAQAVPADTPYTTVLTKTDIGTDDVSEDVEGLKRVVKTAKAGETIGQILIATGASPQLAGAMLEAAKAIYPEGSLVAGHEVHIVLAPSLTDPNTLVPEGFSVFDDGHAHKVTVSRSAAGEFVASADAVDNEAVLRAAVGQGDGQQRTSLYSSVYAAALMQQIPPDTITQILRTHAYETDFRRRIRPGDTLELFFDVKDDLGTDGAPGDLLYTSMTTGGETKPQRYYRFRTPDGLTDFYDDQGNTSRKFLLRKAVRTEDARITSGFGVRFHPLLNERRMHTGVDWATTPGTPIMAAGNGTIEEAGRKGQYGNYVRIRHANGYQTAYGHMLRFADGVVGGVKVRQGQTIGFVGSTGLSSGPHLHFEVLVNNQFVDPMSIQVPREKQLEGRDLGDFQRERVRLDELKARAPVATATK
jgi:murein DD-endopeptidase MepM/ murein hydrolase activator NlpD